MEHLSLSNVSSPQACVSAICDDVPILTMFRKELLSVEIDSEGKSLIALPSRETPMADTHISQEQPRYRIVHPRILCDAPLTPDDVAAVDTSKRLDQMFGAQKCSSMNKKQLIPHGHHNATHLSKLFLIMNLSISYQ
jgi:hypothetical protein